ncbi:DNA-binding IclR family transcriptional regulator [Nitrobacteraceae bacterium AZCC 2161]
MVHKRKNAVKPRVNRNTTAEETEGKPSGSLMRGLEVLKVFRSGQGRLGNAEIAAATGIPRASVSRLTRGLLEAGYLAYDYSDARYHLRPRVLTLGFSMLSNLPILPIAHSHMQQFARTSGCTVSLAAADGGEMIYLDRCSGEALPYFFSTGSAVETARTACGRAYLASLSEEERQEAFLRLKPQYPKEWKRIEKEIKVAVCDVATRGFCLVDNTWRTGIRAIAAPLSSRDRRTTLAVNCITPTHSMDVHRLVDLWGPGLVGLVRELERQF